MIKYINTSNDLCDDKKYINKNDLCVPKRENMIKKLTKENFYIKINS